MSSATYRSLRRGNRESLTSTRSQCYAAGFALIEPYGTSVPVREPIELTSRCCFSLTEPFDPITMVMLPKDTAK